MMQQIQQPCRDCSATGYSTPHSDRCTACGGTCLVAEKKVFEVHVEKVYPNPQLETKPLS